LSVINRKELVQVLKIDHDMKEMIHYFLKQVEKEKAKEKGEEEKKAYIGYMVLITEKEIVPKKTREVEIMIAQRSQVSVQMQLMMMMTVLLWLRNCQMMK